MSHMKLHHQFLQLHSRYGEMEVIEITLDELAQTLECTHRNVTNVVNKLVHNEWISWESHRGRGRRSRLEFIAQPEDIAVQTMVHAINRKDITRAIDQLRVHRRSSTLQEHLQGWLLTYFGHHSEMSSDRQIDTLRIPIRQQIHTVDPLYMNLLAEAFVSSHVFDGLVRRASHSHEILPSIAHSWEADEAQKKWTFYLRKEVLFHNGKVMTADDVVYSFERLIQSPRRTLFSFIFKQIKAVQALNPTTVSIELEQPSELFLPFLCTSRAAIVPKELNQLGNTEFGIHPVGTGPFRITEMNAGMCVLEVFTPYFQGRAHLDRVEVVHVPWDTPSTSSDNPFHIIHNPSSTEDSWSQLHSDTLIRKFITFNTKKAGPLSDPTIRAHLIACLSELSENAASPRNSEEPITLQITTIPPYKQDAAALADKLALSGYSCSVVSVSPEDFKGAIRLQSDLILFSLYRDQDEQLRLTDLYLTIAEHVEPHTRIDIETLLQAVMREADPQARALYLNKIEARLIQEKQLYILSEKPLPTAYLPSVRGVTFNSQGWVNLRTIWFPPQLK